MVTAAGRAAIRRRALVALLLAVAASAPAACGEDEIGAPLKIELTGPDSGRIGEEVQVRYAVTARRLNGIVFAWGDGTVDSLAAAGAQSAHGAMRHVYEEAGLFLVSARAEDAVEGVAKAEVSVNIHAE